MKFGPIGVLDALKMAIQSEIDLDHFFSETSKVATDDDVRLVFRKYSREAKKNRIDLQEKYRMISGKRLLYLNLNKKRKLEMSMEYGSSRQDLISAAKQNVKACYTFYSDFSHRLLELDFRAIFNTLAETKEKQLEHLEAKFPQTELDSNVEDVSQKSRSTVSEAA